MTIRQDLESFNGIESYRAKEWRFHLYYHSRKSNQILRLIQFITLLYESFHGSCIILFKIDTNIIVLNDLTNFMEGNSNRTVVTNLTLNRRTYFGPKRNVLVQD